jgi:hypothetical protein
MAVKRKKWQLKNHRNCLTATKMAVKVAVKAKEAVICR